MQTQPRINLIRIMNPSHTSLQMLRGGHVLRLLTREQFLGKFLDLIEVADGRIFLPASGILFADLDCVAGLTAGPDPIWNRYPLILDVHFPIWDPDALVALHPDTGEISEALTDDARDYWASSEVQQAALDLVRSAAVVTTPYEHWATELRKYNRSVYVLPDTKDTHAADAFCRTFVRLLDTAYLGWRGSNGHKVSLMARIRCRISQQVWAGIYRRSWLEFHDKLERFYAQSLIVPWGKM